MMDALLVLLKTKNDIYDIEYRIAEMKNLCSSIDVCIKDTIYQTIDKPDPRYYTGSGKIYEIKEKASSLNVDFVAFDDQLSPAQLKNIGEIIDKDIIDRTSIILDIFKTRASSKEAMLQINLAKALYDLPRIGLNMHNLSREGASGGGLHSKGAGETNQELQRRDIAHKISKYKEELNEIKSRKQMTAEKRAQNQIPIVALVGYTNAGKSTTMNKLIEVTDGNPDKCVYAEDMLFATLDTRVRQITYKKHKFLLTDTIGFVSKLPSLLVESFRSTLEEIRNADLIIHVLDFSSPYFSEQYAVTMQMLESVKALDKKMLILLNKYDKLDGQNLILQGVESLPYSNYTNLNVHKLLDYIYEETIPYMIELKLNIPYKEGKIINIIEEKATIYEKLYLEDNTYYHISIDKKYYKELSLFEDNNVIN